MNNQGIKIQAENYEHSVTKKLQDIKENLRSVNYHVTKACNYSCKFCFARFTEIDRFLPLNKATELISQLARYGTEKITFVGGEPFLSPYLGELLEFSKALNLTTMIVTNGSLVSSQFLENYSYAIDWMGFSVDSGIESIEKQLGRHVKKEAKERPSHVQTIRSIIPLVREYKIKIKINTVVTSLNWQEDMNWLIQELKPQRWKVFQVLKILGENDTLIDPLLITQEQFQHFIDGHHENQPIAESNNNMVASYIMIGPLGRFFDNSEGKYTYSRAIIDVGVVEAFGDITFLLTKLRKRGGSYLWNE